MTCKDCKFYENECESHAQMRLLGKERGMEICEIFCKTYVDCWECINFDECHYSGFLTGRLTSCPDYKQKPMTNADHLLEAISTEEGLAKFLMRVHDEGIYIPFCPKKDECWGLIEENGIPDEKCMECMMQWMRKPYEGD